MNELTGIANQQNSIDAEALTRPILTQPSRNRHELRSISAGLCQIDKLRLPVIIVQRTCMPSRAVALVRRDAKSTER